MAYIANNFPRDGEGSGWFHIAPKRKVNPSLTGKIIADVVIVGAGVTGLACAHRMAELNPKFHIVLVESLAVAQGASGRNSGFMIDMPHDLQTNDYTTGDDKGSTEIAFNRYGIDFATKKSKQFKMDKACFSIDGKYHAAAGAAGENALINYSKGLESIGEKYTILDAKDMKECMGTDYYTMGIHTPYTPIIQPAQYHMEMANNLPKNVSLYENTNVVSVQDGNNLAVKTTNGFISCGQIILTTNAHMESFGFKKNRLMNIMLTGSMTRQLTDVELKKLGGIDAWALTPADPLGSSIRKTRDGRILVRNQAFYNPNLYISPEKINTHLKRHQSAFDLRFPILEGVKMEHTWGGNLCLSRNNVSVFESVAENIYAVGVNNGLGLAKGTTQGVLMAEYLSGEKSLFADALLNQAQPSRIFPEPFMTMGMTIGLNYKIWRAGKDL